MCTVCGCHTAPTLLDASPHEHAHDSAHAHDHDHAHGHQHPHDHAHGHRHDHPYAHHVPLSEGHPQAGDLHYGQGPARAHAPGLSQARMVAIEQNILSKNDHYAGHNRQRLAALDTLALNLVSSPGAGKTTLLCATVKALLPQAPVAVIEGDQQTSADAERIRATGAPALQINTGKGCHLDAHMVGHAIDRLGLQPGGVLFIENVGNLVCPAAFDLGEAAKVVVLSITEGEDKPLKYPDMFAAAELMVINKVDLAPYLPVDLDAIEANARRVNPTIQALRLSAYSGEGLAAWLAWIQQRHARLMAFA